MPSSVKNLYTDQEINVTEKKASDDNRSRQREFKARNNYEQDLDWGYEDKNWDPVEYPDNSSPNVYPDFSDVYRHMEEGNGYSAFKDKFKSLIDTHVR
jgi:hypothetical protein